MRLGRAACVVRQAHHENIFFATKTFLILSLSKDAGCKGRVP
jgi:hypothetical protein